MTVRDLIEQSNVVELVPTAEIPALLGELEKLKAALWARLLNPNVNGRAGGATQPDRRLNVEEAARKLGTSKDWLYRHSGDLPFVIRMGRGVGFSERGIELWLRQRTGS